MVKPEASPAPFTEDDSDRNFRFTEPARVALLPAYYGFFGSQDVVRTIIARFSLTSPAWHSSPRFVGSSLPDDGARAKF